MANASTRFWRSVLAASRQARLKYLTWRSSGRAGSWLLLGERPRGAALNLSVRLHRPDMNRQGISSRGYTAADRIACLALFDGNTPEFFAPAERNEFSH